jgi:aspartyl protease
MLTFPYESAEDPPAPYVDLQISPPRREHLRVEFRGKLDSGAGLTVIPDSLARLWHLRQRDRVFVRAFDGSLSMRPLYRVDLTIGTRHFGRVPVTMSRRTNVLIGRDLLNQLTITLDGPDLRVEIHDA